MDPITQGAIGAIVATAVAPAKRVRLAAFVGWAGGMLADADIFIRSASDPLLNIEYHRHFSHSLLFIPIGTLI
ncbi:MAG: metal-dependent hydrolase, partial [Verrucomicrobiia bacterium]